jgi:serine protease Do
MIKRLFTACLVCLTGFANAQKEGVVEERLDSMPDRKARTNNQKVVTVRIKGDKAKGEKYTIEIDGNNVKVNGKDVTDLKDIDVTIGNNSFFFNKVSPRTYQLRTVPKEQMEEMHRKLRELRGENGALQNRIQEIRAGKRALLGINMEKAEGGVKITSVTEESAAAKAGLQKEDIIVSINGKPVVTEMEISKMVSAEKPGAEMNITYKREGKEKKAKAILGQRNDMEEFGMFEEKLMPMEGFGNNLQEIPFETPGIPNFDFKMDGSMPDIHLFKDGQWQNGQHLFGNNGPKLGVSLKETESGNGLEVTNVQENSIAAKAGLQKGDIVTKVAGTDVNDIQDIRKLVQENKEKSFEVNYLRNGKAGKVTVQFPKQLKETDM